MGTFALDLQRFAEKCGERADDAVGNIVVRIAQELDKRSPVGDALYWTAEGLHRRAFPRELATRRRLNACG